MKIPSKVFNRRRGVLLAMLLAQAFPLHLRAQGTVAPPLLEFTSGLPGEQVRLTWLAQAGVKYRIEKSTNLETGGLDGWRQVALVEATSTAGDWRDPEPTTTKAFYRVAQPVAEVFSISPPLLSTAGGVLSLQGQSIPAGSFLVLNIDGSLISVPLSLVAGVWQAAVGPLAEGASVIAVGIAHNGGTIVSLNTPITVTTTGLAPDAPPTLPPGAPVVQVLPGAGGELDGHGPRLPPGGPVVQEGQASAGRSLPSGAPPELDSVKPISGIGIVVKRNPYATSGERAARTKRFPASLFAHNIMQRLHLQMQGNPLSVKSDGSAEQNPEASATTVGERLIAAWLSKKGYEYYQAKSNMASAGAQNNPYFKNSGNQGEMVPMNRGLPGEVHIPVSALFLDCPAGPNIDWVCTYRSMVPVSTGLGQGWDFSYNIFIEPLSADRVAIHDGQGRRDIFHRQPDDNFTCPGMFRTGRFDGETFTLTFADAGKWVFRPLNDSTAPGKIATITDRNDVSLFCGYVTGTAKLSSVSSQFGQSITVTYTGDQISSIADHTGRFVSFTRDLGEPDNLCSISCPQENGGPVVAGPVMFAYTTGNADPRLNGNLLSATDGAGRTLGIFTYSAETDPLHIDYDTCATAERHKTGHVSINRRESRPDGGYTIFEIDEVGRVTETDLDRLHRLIACRQFTGFSRLDEAVTSSSNRPTGKLRDGDPEFFETTCTYNSDSLCTRTTHPDGSQEITIYDRDFRRNCPVREGGNPRSMTLQTPGGEQRTVSCDYLPGFGTLENAGKKCATGKHFTGQLLETGHGHLRALAPNGGITAMDDWESPVVRMLSAHGQITTRSYDSKGNLTSVTSPVPGRGSLYEYNALGQITSSTTLNGTAPSFVDACNYDAATKFLSSVVSDSGGLNLTTALYRDNRGRIIRTVDPRGNDELCSYNALDQIVEIKSPPVPQRIARTFHYDAGACLARCDVEHRGSDGTLVLANPAYSSFFVYDDHGLLIQTAEEERPVTPLPDALAPTEGQLASYAVCDITLNNAGECVRLSTPAVCRAQADARVCDFTYDERGMLHRTHEGGTGNADGLVTECDYDFYGALTRCAVSGQGITSVETCSYDGFHRLASEEDAMGNVSSYEYDNRGYVTCSVFGEVNDVPGSTDNVLLSRIVAPFSYHAINTKGAGAQDRIVAPVSYHAINTKGAGAQDRIVAPFSYHAINTKGAGANNRIVAPVSYHAINTKGAGANNRIVAPVSYHAINTKGAGGINRMINPFFGFETEDETITSDRFTHGGAITAEVTTIDYSPAGLIQQISRNGDLLETCSYDTAGRLNGHICGQTSHFFTLNPNGDVVSSARTDTCPSDAMQTKTFTVSHAIDAAGRITQTTDGTGDGTPDNIGNVSSYAYDSLHRPVSCTEPGGLVTRCAYDGSSSGIPFSQEISADAETAGIHVMLSRSLVRSGELQSTTDSYGHTTTFRNDALGRPKQTDFPDGTFETRTYAHINLGSIGHLDRGKTTLTHNLNGQLASSLTSSDPLIAPVSSTPLKTFTHDGLRRLTSASQGTHVVAYAYDSLGNLVAESQNGRVVSSTYDHRGRTGITYPDGRSFVEARDGIGRLVSISALDAGVPVVPPVLANEYAGHRIFRSRQGNGIVTTYRYRGDGEASLPNAADYSFDACVRTSVGNHSITTVHRDRNQRIIRDATAFSTAGTPPIRIKAIGRNRLGDLILCTTRLRSVEGAALVDESQVSYTRDFEGRRISELRNTIAGTYTQASTLPLGDQQMGQYTTWPNGTLEWDDNGNLISMATATGALSLVHDVEGRVVSASRAGIPKITYDYDPLGRCIKRDPEVGPTTTFVYDGDECIQELDENGDAELSLVISGGIKQCISTRNGTIYYPHAVHAVAVQGYIVNSHATPGLDRRWKAPELNSNQDRVALITNAAGVVVERFDCDDAGKPIFLNPAGLLAVATQSAIPFRWLAPACAWEPEIDMFQCPSGFHSPALGADISSQKIKITGEIKKGHEYVGHVSLIR